MGALGMLFMLCLAPAVSAAEVATFEIVARDARLFPERLEVPAGVKLKLTLRNEGKVPVEFENLDLRVEKILAPDSVSVVTVQPLKPGSYTFIDDFHAATGKMLIIAK
ncbi:MAG: cupredoxin domain-containing protein [Burkholderiales bacterium]|nr:cupredoxin domain-containing protein [Burkholderiales bacterium]